MQKKEDNEELHMKKCGVKKVVKKGTHTHTHSHTLS